MDKYFEIIGDEIELVEKENLLFTNKDKSSLINRFLEDLKIDAKSVDFSFNLTNHKNLLTVKFNH